MNKEKCCLKGKIFHFSGPLISKFEKKKAETTQNTKSSAESTVFMNYSKRECHAVETTRISNFQKTSVNMGSLKASNLCSKIWYLSMSNATVIFQRWTHRFVVPLFCPNNSLYFRSHLFCRYQSPSLAQT